MICENYDGLFPQPEKASAKAIIREVCAEFDISEAAIKGGCRAQKFSLARWKAAARMRDELGFSSTQIGNMLGGRDHTTILHGFRRWDLMNERAA